MPPKPRWLEPQEVKGSWHQYLDFDKQKMRGRSRLSIWAACPGCGKERWLRVHLVRHEKTTLRCRSCCKLQYLKPEEIEQGWREYYDFDRQESREGNLRIWTKCPLCSTARWTVVHNIRYQDQSPRCQLCAATLDGPDSHAWRGGRRHSRGYVEIHQGLLTPDEYRKMASMFTNKGYVREHRLVMARHLGRPLRDDEIVHHINGIKDDNRLENLRLLTTETHHGGYGDDYYQKWQEALAEIGRLKNTREE